MVGLPLACSSSPACRCNFDYPEMRALQFRGGIEILPEFVALLFGLSIYTAAFIAEIVRAGILAVATGQTEAAYSLGLRRARRCGWSSSRRRCA